MPRDRSGEQAEGRWWIVGDAEIRSSGGGRSRRHARRHSATATRGGGGSRRAPRQVQGRSLVALDRGWVEPGSTPPAGAEWGTAGGPE
jgi:hypothetical protein